MSSQHHVETVEGWAATGGGQAIGGKGEEGAGAKSMSWLSHWLAGAPPLPPSLELHAARV